MANETQVPTVEVKLPETEQVVVFKQNLTTGQSRELQRMLLKNGRYDQEKKTIDNLTMDAFMDIQDKAAEFLITDVKKTDGSSIPFTQEWLYNLPAGDGQKVYDQINAITGQANMTKEERKN